MIDTNFRLPSRRLFLLAGSAGLVAACSNQTATSSAQTQPNEADFSNSEWRDLTPEQWRERLSAEAYEVLRREGTERAFTSPLNDEKRAGVFHCTGCDLALFDAATKYDSGTGWPSFFDFLPGALATKPDNKLWMQRTEYHCARCLGHQGHVFEGGPAPTRLRYCNNGVALTFQAA